MTSYCHKTDPGLAHDVNIRHWTCFYGQKHGQQVVKTHNDPFHPHGRHSSLPRHVPGNTNANNVKCALYRPRHAAGLQAAHLSAEAHQRVVAAVKAQTSTWEASLHEPFARMGVEELLRVRGGRRSWAGRRPQPAAVTAEQQRAADQLPPAFDWRDVNGANFVSSVR